MYKISLHTFQIILIIWLLAIQFLFATYYHYWYRSSIELKRIHAYFTCCKHMCYYKQNVLACMQGTRILIGFQFSRTFFYYTDGADYCYAGWGRPISVFCLTRIMIGMTMTQAAMTAMVTAIFTASILSWSSKDKVGSMSQIWFSWRYIDPHEKCFFGIFPHFQIILHPKFTNFADWKDFLINKNNELL